MQADVLTVDLPKKCARGVILSHFLEHLPQSKVRTAINKAVALSKDFVYIEGPSFDFDNYLKSVGLKFSVVTTLLLKRAFSRANILAYTLMVQQPYITRSNSPDLHPLDSPKDQFTYDPTKHPPKPSVKLTNGVFRSFIMIGWITNDAKKTFLKRAVHKQRQFKVIADVKI